jgi:S1-C subfamily serine protease
MKAMARTPEIPPLKIRGKKTPATMGAIHWQGATLRKMEGQEFSAIGVAVDAVGVFAAEVPERSAAYDAGLRQGDLIQQVSDQAVRNAKEFLDAVTAAPKEQTLNLKIIRNQKTQTLNINAPTKP